ncbi:MAG: TIGR00269 family protein [Candidatus Aenigmatarchaeota archaeon]|nr:MAG: TIGR00269 family protein [Candidatus Aenigmarchaeota archaeon]
MERCKCGRRAVFFRRYEGTYLCDRHFTYSIEKKVKRNIRVNRLIRSGDRIGIAVSGGKDSMSLLHIMNEILGPRRDIDFLAITIDEGIRPYREKGIRYAKEYCKKLGIEHHIYSFKDIFGKSLDEKMKEFENPESGLSCTLCGVGRRYILNKVARELGLNKLCLGHNLDDEAQAIIMNYIRGDLFRASRMGPKPVVYDKKFVGRIKPMRIIPEEEIKLYATLKGIKFQEKNCPYKSGIRLEVREFLNKLEENHPGIKFIILETFDRLLPYIRQCVKNHQEKVTYCKFCGEPSSKDVCKTCVLWRE